MYVRDTWTYLHCGMIYHAVETIRGISGGGGDDSGIGGVVVRGVPLTVSIHIVQILKDEKGLY